MSLLSETNIFEFRFCLDCLADNISIRNLNLIRLVAVSSRVSISEWSQRFECRHCLAFCVTRVTWQTFSRACHLIPILHAGGDARSGLCCWRVHLRAHRNRVLAQEEWHLTHDQQASAAQVSDPKPPGPICGCQVAPRFLTGAQDIVHRWWFRRPCSDCELVMLDC